VTLISSILIRNKVLHYEIRLLLEFKEENRMNLTQNEIDIKGMGIYKITNTVNNKVYVGSSVKMKRRLSEHCNKLRKGKHDNPTLQRDWNAYGEDSFKFEAIMQVEKETDLPILEKEEISKYKQYDNTYNYSDPTEEAIKGRVTKKIKIVRIREQDKIEVFKWLDENHKDKIILLCKHIEEQKYYIKEKVDEWFLKQVKLNFSINEDELLQILNKWYNKYNLCIVKSSMYKRAFNKLYNKKLDHTGLLLIDWNVNKELYTNRFRN
jgi:group I intron endonuclease